MITRDDAAARDRDNPLAEFHDRFVRAEGLLYLDGNSLGRPPRATAARLATVVTSEWGGELVTAWDRWVDLAQEVGDRLGAVALGASAGQTAIADSTTVNLFKLAGAALANATRRVIVADPHDFPTDRYVLAGVAHTMGGSVRWIDADPFEPRTVDVVAPALDDDVALVCLSAVSFRSAAKSDVAGITAATHASGALALWDLCHAAGAIEIRLDDDDVDLAVGCTYKYLNGGPGAPAYLYVSKKLQSLVPPIWGWWGRAEPFSMAKGFEPAAGIRGFLSGTPNILGISAVDEGVHVLSDAGIGAVEAASRELTTFLGGLVDERLAPLGFDTVSPRDAASRGGHIALTHHEAGSISTALRTRGVVIDARPPDLLRLAPTPLDTCFVDVWDAVDRIAALVASGAHRDVAPATRVT